MTSNSPDEKMVKRWSKVSASITIILTKYTGTFSWNAVDKYMEHMKDRHIDMFAAMDKEELEDCIVGRIDKIITPDNTPANDIAYFESMWRDRYLTQTEIALDRTKRSKQQKPEYWMPCKRVE